MRRTPSMNHLAEKLSLAFVGVAVLLAMLVPENTYEQHEALRAFVDSVALYFNVINEFSAASSFPGATRVVLVLMWSLVVPMALLLRLYPGVLRWREEDLRRLGILGRLVWFIFLAAFGGILPNVVTVEGGGRAEAWIRVGAGSRLALGIMAGTYCAAVAFVLAWVPLLLDPRFYFEKRDPRRVAP